MADSVHTDSVSLCKLVRWAHSHGTICGLIPGLQTHVRAAHLNLLGPEAGQPGGPVVTWGCRAGHAYHWPLGPAAAAAAILGPERPAAGRSSHGKVLARASFDLSCSDAASEGEEFRGRLMDAAGCDSSATDEDGDGERQGAEPGKRGGASAEVTLKRLKREASPDGYEAADVPRAPDSPGAQSGGAVKPEAEAAPGGGSARGTAGEARTCSSATGTAELRAAADPCDPSLLESLRASLSSERSRNQHMMEIISSLKQDKELLQNEISRKAELICELLQDKVQPERRWTQSGFADPGSSHMTPAEEADPAARFDSFGEMELHPPELHPPELHPPELHPPEPPRTLMGKRIRDGENPRVRMKNVAGVIARYTAALQEFRRSVSMKVAFDRVGVDRNTISRTAAIAELSLAAPEVFHLLAPWDEREETLAHYAHRCRQAMDDAIRLKIKIMKAKGELLPIVSK